MSTKRTGKCINFGNCAKADRHEIIELDVTEDFICPECNSDLEEDGGGGNNKGPKKGLIIGIIVAIVLLGGGAAAYFLLGNDDDDIVMPPKVERTTEPKAEPEVIQPEAVQEEVAVEPEPEPKPEQKPAPTKTTPTVTSGTVAVTGGSYTGELKDGKPHGMGTVKYTASTLIDSRDAKQRRAEPGQYITGQYHEGRLVQGKLYDASNNQLENIILGRP